MKTIINDQLRSIGFTGRPSGFHGALNVSIESGEPSDYSDRKFLFIQLEGKPVPFLVEELSITGTGLVVKLEDVNSEAEAKSISGKKVFVLKSWKGSNSEVPDWQELIGFNVFEKKYGKLGKLERLEEFPQQLIGYCNVNGKEIIFPLHEDFIERIDDKKKEIRLTLPEGLLDVYLK